MTWGGAWWRAAWLAALASPMAVMAALLFIWPNYDRLFGSFSFHFYAVSAVTILAAIAYVFLIAITQSLRETRLLFLGLGFLSIAAIFAVHGLGTPGHIHDAPYAELSVSSWLSVTVGAFFIFLSVVRLPEKAESFVARNGTFILGGTTALMGIYIGMSFASPGWLAFLPYESREVQLAGTALTLGLLAFSAMRYFQAFTFARLISQWAMFCLMVLLIEVQLSMTFGRYWSYSWWLYHGIYGLAFPLLFGAWFFEIKRAGSVRALAEALSMRDAMAQLSQGYSRPIADLVEAIEWKDRYTHGHVRRVASYAVMIGKELELPSQDLRNLALAAQLHDVGKISVPDKVLGKPARLTPKEFAVIKMHVERGFEIAKSVKALEGAVDGIYLHHERWDGTGYPSGLTGEEIPAQARIVAVADSFDAMTSGRTYQPAVSDEAALAELGRCRGTHFDPHCVDAFVSALAKARESEQFPMVQTAVDHNHAA